MTKVLTTFLVSTLCVLCGAASAFAQSPAQGGVLIRNVLVKDGELMEKADVLVFGGRLVRAAEGAPAPAGAVVIDGGGSAVTLDADGQVRLSPVSGPAAGSTPTEGRAAGDKPALVDEHPVPERAAAGGVGQMQPQTPAAQGGQPAAGHAAEENLAAAVVDPTASIKTLTFQNRFAPSLWGIDDEQNEVDMQLGIPHSAFGRRNILRVTIPYTTSTPAGGRGLSDVSVFNILLFPKKWGTLAVGAVASLGTNKGPGVDTFALGPAVGLVFKKGKWTYGVFSQNLFSLDDIATTQLQPILAYTLNKKWSFALGDAQYTVDWTKGRFTNLPLSVQANYVTNFGEQPIRLFVNPQYNLKNEFGSRKWTVTTGLALIVR